METLNLTGDAGSSVADSRPATDADLIAAVSTVIADLSSPIVDVDELSTHPPLMGQPLIEPLTQRELEVLQLLAQGLTNPQIADQLTIALGTVKSYTAHIYDKLGVRNRIQAVTRAQKLSLLD